MMNNEQREYTVTQIQKNTEESKRLDKSAARSAFFVGLLGIGTIMNVLMTHDLPPIFQGSNIETVSRILQSSLALITGFGAVSSLKSLVEKICTKAGLKNMNTQLNYDLQMDELEKGGKAR